MDNIVGIGGLTEHLVSTEGAPSLDDVKDDWLLAEEFQAFWDDGLIVPYKLDQ